MNKLQFIYKTLKDYEGKYHKWEIKYNIGLKIDYIKIHLNNGFADLIPINPNLALGN